MEFYICTLWHPGSIESIIKLLYNNHTNCDADAEVYRPALHSSRFADIAGDDEGAKQAVAALAADLGFAPLDVGPLSQARYTEPLAMLWITLVCLWSFFHLLCSAHLARRISRSLAAITLSSSSESELFVPYKHNK